MSGSRAEIQFQLYATKPAVEPCVSPGATGGRLPRVTQVLALAIQFQDMIERGDARDYADLARLGCLSRERMSQIMELIWLAPDIQVEILGFPSTHTSRFPVSEVAVRRIAAKPRWEEQRNLWAKLKKENNLRIKQFSTSIHSQAALQTIFRAESIACDVPGV